jgi:hypothetical protein
MPFPFPKPAPLRFRSATRMAGGDIWTVLGSIGRRIATGFIEHITTSNFLFPCSRYRSVDGWGDPHLTNSVFWSGDEIAAVTKARRPCQLSCALLCLRAVAVFTGHPSTALHIGCGTRADRLYARSGWTREGVHARNNVTFRKFAPMTPVSRNSHSMAT